MKLLEKSNNENEYVTAAKNIRIELKAAFPAVKFSVTTKSYSMGNNCRVSWIDGPTNEQVSKIVDKYSAGDFDGMDDLYTYRKNEFIEKHGSAKYVFTSRCYSKGLLEETAKKEVAKFGMEWKGMDALYIGVLSAQLHSDGYQIGARVLNQVPLI